jgi:hypothetical protein
MSLALDQGEWLFSQTSLGKCPQYALYRRLESERASRDAVEKKIS